MKIKNILITLMCIILMGTAVYAEENIQVLPEEKETTLQEEMPAENMPSEFEENGENTRQGRMPRGGFGGRNRGFGENPDEGNFPGGFENREEFGGETSENFTQSENVTSSADAQQSRYSVTYISSAVLLILGFLFAVFYKRRTF